MPDASRLIICEQCKRHRRTAYAYDFCYACMKKLEKQHCSQCRKMVYMLEPGSAKCRRCVNRVTKVKIICASCGIRDYTLSKDPLHCRKCQPKMEKRNWVKSLPKTIVCTVCGEVKPPVKKTEMVCQVCNNKRRNGEVKCVIPGCDKQINNKRWQLCKHHHADRLAPAEFTKYYENYTSPFPQNRHYLAAFVATMNLAGTSNGVFNILERHVFQCRVIGEFLRTTELPEVLTWKAIDNAMPKLDKKAHKRAKLIRSFLLHLGHTAAEQGSIEDRQAYLSERVINNQVRSVPERFRKLVSDFDEWCLSGMLNPKLQLSQTRIDVLCNTPKTRIDTTRALVKFFSWCVERDIPSLPDISPSLVEEYQQRLFWQFECKTCHHQIPFEALKVSDHCANPRCNARSSCTRIRKLSRNYIAGEISKLRVFFDFAQLHNQAASNPVEDLTMKGFGILAVTDSTGKAMEVALAIRRYDDAVIGALCAYMASPDAEPEAALILYLIIFHVFTPAELRNVRIPSCMKSESTLPVSQSEHDYEYLYLPRREPSRGNRSQGRPSQVIKFPDEALTWLVPLLERYYAKRNGVVCTEHHEYLLAMKNRARHNTPVTAHYVKKIVQRASLRILGGSVDPSDLRRTAASVIAKRSKRRGAVLTRMGYSPERATQYNYLENFPLQPKMKTTAKPSQ